MASMTKSPPSYYSQGGGPNKLMSEPTGPAVPRNYGNNARVNTAIDNRRGTPALYAPPPGRTPLGGIGTLNQPPAGGPQLQAEPAGGPAAWNQQRMQAQALRRDPTMGGRQTRFGRMRR